MFNDLLFKLIVTFVLLLLEIFLFVFILVHKSGCVALTQVADFDVSWLLVKVKFFQLVFIFEEFVAFSSRRFIIETFLL